MTYYLVRADTYGCVEYDILVGIAQNKTGLYEIFNNYFKMMQTYQSFEKYKVENDINELIVYEITDEDFVYLQNIYASNETMIYKKIKKEYNFEAVSGYSCYFFTKTSSELIPQFDILNKKQLIAYMKILEKSNIVIK